MKEVTGINAKKKWFSFLKTDFMKPVYYILITAFISPFVGHFYWKRQFENTRGQTFLEMKIKTFENYSSTAQRMIQLSEYYNRIRIDKLKLIEEITYKMLDTANMKDGIPVVMCPNSKTQDSCINIIAKNEPKIYENYLDFLDFQNEDKSKTSIAVLLFDVPVRNEIYLFQDLFSDNELKKQMLEQKGNNEFWVRDIDVVKLMNKMAQDKQEQLTKVLFEMSNEIYGE